MFPKLRTPDNTTDPVTYRSILILMPSNVDIERFFWGAVSTICFHTAWIEEGTMSPEEAAFYLKAIVNSRKEFDLLGTVQIVFREELDSSMLLCDGGVYNKDDYPQLWEVWPSAMKDATSLTLPDLRNLFLVGAGSDYSRGDTGGEAEVTLTLGQIPSHSHSTHTYTFNIDVESAGIPDPTAIGLPELPDSTGSAGGDGSHENRPPYYAVVYAVIAKVTP